MSRALSPLAQDLRSIFARALEEMQPACQMKFSRRRLKIDRTGFLFLYLANWPQASCDEIDAALLSLHHAGYIVYGSNTVTLKDTLLDWCPTLALYNVIVNCSELSRGVES